MEAVLEQTLCELSERVGYEVILKPEQQKSVTELLYGRDVLAVLPTGFGKSLIFQVFTIAKSKLQILDGGTKSPSIVICPLESIMKDQIAEAQSLGITACSLTESKLDEVSQNPPQLVFASAESVEDPAFRVALKDKNSQLHKSVSLIAVDESHTVETWTAKRKTGRRKGERPKVFRSAFGELSVLRSLCKSGTPVLALTGSADDTTQKNIASSLAMQTNYVKVFISPNRTNLRISVIKTSKSQIFNKLNWLVKVMREKGIETPKTLIFCNTITDIASVLNHLLLVLGKDAYNPRDCRKAGNCLIDVYHAMTWASNKDNIVSSLKQTGQNSCKRIVVASTALSMGVNFPDISFIINWGPARNLLDHHQEAGRAWRDGKNAHNVVIYHGQMTGQCEFDVKTFVRSESCLRVSSLLPLDPSIMPLDPGHDCCTYCHINCNCESCNISIPAHEIEELDNSRNEIVPHFRHITEEDRLDLKSALGELISFFNSQGSIVLSSTIQVQLLSDLVDKSNSISTVKDISNNFPILSLQHIFNILEVFDEIFEDIECVTEMIELLPNIQLENIDITSEIECATFDDNSTESDNVLEYI